MKQLHDLLDMIKFEHTLFALPFALLSLFLASGGWPSVVDFTWVVVAMVGARSTAMMMNRIADRHIDADNPRTRERHLPRGAVRLRSARFFTLASAALFVFAAAQLNQLAFALSPVALALVWSYSWTKRFTWAAHLWLGFGVSLAPLGAWIAVRGRLDLLPMLLCAGVFCWVAGFDMIYACQDIAFDRRRGLHSFPARFGTAGALATARLLHGLMLGVFACIGILFDFGILYWVGLGVVALLVLVQHTLVDPHDLRHIEVAFFNVNSMVGVVLMAFTLADRFVFT